MPLKFRGWEFTGDVKPVFDERKERSTRAHKIAVLAAQILDMMDKNIDTINADGTPVDYGHELTVENDRLTAIAKQLVRHLAEAEVMQV